MKKLITILVILIFSQTTGQAQEKKKFPFPIEEISIGGMITGGVSLMKYIPAEDKDEKKKIIFPLFGTISPSFNWYTQYTHNHVSWEMFSNSFQTLHGFYLNDYWDTYVFFQKSINNPSKYMSIGIERYFPFKKENNYLSLVTFAEIGTTKISDLSLYSISVGVTFYPEAILWKKKK